MARKAYPTDLTSNEREIMKPYLPAEVSGGRGSTAHLELAGDPQCHILYPSQWLCLAFIAA